MVAKSKLIPQSDQPRSMELFNFSLLSVFVFMASISIINLLFYKPKPSCGTLPPGKSGLPLIGESIEFIIRPDKFICGRMAKYSPNVFRTNILGEQFAVLCGAAGNKFLFSNENKLVQVCCKTLVLTIRAVPPNLKNSYSPLEYDLFLKKA